MNSLVGFLQLWLIHPMCHPPTRDLCDCATYTRHACENNHSEHPQREGTNAQHNAFNVQSLPGLPVFICIQCLGRCLKERHFVDQSSRTQKFCPRNKYNLQQAAISMAGSLSFTIWNILQPWAGNSRLYRETEGFLEGTRPVFCLFNPETRKGTVT